MAEYDNTNRFALFKNDKGDNPKRPDYTGTINVDGVEKRISGWVTEGKNGRKFISGSVADAEPKESKPTTANAFEEDVPF